MAWFIVQSLIVLVLAFLLGIVVGWLLWARRRPADVDSTELAAAKKQLAAARKQLALCSCGAGDETDADGSADVGAEAQAPEADPETDAVEADPDGEADLDSDEPVATDEAPEEIDVDPDSPTVSADGTAEVDDVAALALAVGALNEPGAKDDAGAADDEAVDRVPDDIERIEGIGPKIGKALRAARLDTFAVIADASQEALREAIEKGGVKFAPSIESWSSQARLLADGDEAGFLALTDRLVAGRVKD